MIKPESVKEKNSVEYPQVFVQFGHTAPVESVAFSPDGKYIISGSQDNTIRLWDVLTGKEIRVFKGHYDDVTSVAFSPDRKFVLSGSQDNTIRLWDVLTGKKIRFFKGHYDDVTCVTFSPDGKYVMSGSDDNTARIWDVQTGKEIRVFRRYRWTVTSVAFSPDGKLTVLGGKDSTVRLWDVQTGKEIRVFKGHKYDVTSVAFSPDGKFVLSGSDDSTIRLWNVKTGKGIRVFEGYQYDVTSVAFSPDGKFVLSGNSDNIVRLWDVQTGKKTWFGEHEDNVTSVTFSPDGKYMLSGSQDKTIRLWDMHSGKKIRVFKAHLYDWYVSVTSTAFSPNGKSVISGSSDGTIQLSDMQTGKKIRVFRGHENDVTSIAFTPDGKYVLSRSKDNIVWLWDVQTGKEIQSFKGDKDLISVVLSPDEKYVLIKSDHYNGQLWDVQTGKKNRDKNAVGLLRKYKLSKNYDTFQVWDMQNGERNLIFEEYEAGVRAMNLSSDGKYVLLVNWDNTVQLWDVQTGKRIRVFKGGHKYNVTSIAFSPDGNSIVLKLLNTVSLLDMETGSIIFEGHKPIAFSPDGMYIASATDDARVIWDMKTGNEIARFFSAGDEWIVITPEGYYDCSPGAEESLSVLTSPMEAKGIDQFRSRFHRPDIIASRFNRTDSAKHPVIVAEPTEQLDSLDSVTESVEPVEPSVHLPKPTASVPEPLPPAKADTYPKLQPNEIFLLIKSNFKSLNLKRVAEHCPSVSNTIDNKINALCFKAQIALKQSSIFEKKLSRITGIENKNLDADHLTRLEKELSSVFRKMKSSLAHIDYDPSAFDEKFQQPYDNSIKAIQYARIKAYIQTSDLKAVINECNRKTDNPEIKQLCEDVQTLADAKNKFDLTASKIVDILENKRPEEALISHEQEINEYIHFLSVEDLQFRASASGSDITILIQNLYDLHKYWLAASISYRAYREAEKENTKENWIKAKTSLEKLKKMKIPVTHSDKIRKIEYLVIEWLPKAMKLATEQPLEIVSHEIIPPVPTLGNSFSFRLKIWNPNIFPIKDGEIKMIYDPDETVQKSQIIPFQAEEKSETEINTPDTYVIEPLITTDGGDSCIPVTITITSRQEKGIRQSLSLKVPVRQTGDDPQIAFSYQNVPRVHKERIIVDRSSVFITVRIHDNQSFRTGNVNFSLTTSYKVRRIPMGSYYTPSKASNPETEKIFRNVMLSDLKIGDNMFHVSYTNEKGVRNQAVLLVERRSPEYNKVAILIGIEDYPWDKAWDPASVRGDLEAMANVLKQQGYNIKTMKNSTKSELSHVIDKLFAYAGPIELDDGSSVKISNNDDFIFYFAGHGFLHRLPGGDETGYIIPYNGKWQNAVTCYNMSNLAQNVRKLPGKHKLFILDSCHAGLARIEKGSNLPDQCNRAVTEKHGTYFLLSSDSYEKSWMNPARKHSIFSHALVKALQGNADRDDDKCISIDEIASYVKNEAHIEGQNPLIFQAPPFEGGAPAFEVIE